MANAIKITTDGTATTETVNGLQDFQKHVEGWVELLYTDDGDEVAEEVHRRGLAPETVLVRRSSLEDVFLHLTGRSLVD